MNAKVTWKKIIKPGLGILKFKAPGLEFEPGQFFSIKLKSETLLVRPYSVCSLPGEDEAEFYIKAHNDGKVAKFILKLNEGDEAELIGPKGKFVLKDSNKEVYLICAGTGVAPIVCMARTLENKKRKVTVLQGASYIDELEFKEVFEKLNVNYVPTISRPEENTGWNGQTGRVETILDNCSNTDAEVYICGPPPMVAACENILKEKNFKDIFVERYY